MPSAMPKDSRNHDLRARGILKIFWQLEMQTKNDRNLMRHFYQTRAIPKCLRIDGQPFRGELPGTESDPHQKRPKG